MIDRKIFGDELRERAREKNEEEFPQSEAEIGGDER
jgi:hypothetical protein